MNAEKETCDAKDEIRIEFIPGAPAKPDSGGSGRWHVSEEVEVYDLDEGIVFVSPDEPSHVSYVALWKEPDGAVRVSFEHVYGNPGLMPSYVPRYGRAVVRALAGSDEEKLAFNRSHRLFDKPEEMLSATFDQTWSLFCRRYYMTEGPEDALSTTALEWPILETRDGGDTWEQVGMEPKPGNHRFFVHNRKGEVLHPGRAPVRCRDGRIVSTVESGHQKDGSLLGIKESMDDGETWLPEQHILPEGSDPEIIRRRTGETAMVELDDGRLLVIIGNSGDIGSIQTFLTRLAPGKYSATPPVRMAGIPPSGQPHVLRGEDGIIWYWACDGHYYTLDNGETWRKTSQRMLSYYPQMVQIGPNRMLGVTHTLGDLPYPHWFDAAIRQYRFSYRRSGVMEQQDPAAPQALHVAATGGLADLHLRAQVRFDGANGLAFRIQPDGDAYYVFAVVQANDPDYGDWELSIEGMRTINANRHTAMWALSEDHPMAILARVDHDELVILRRMRLHDDLEKGAWVQMQVRVEGDLLQGAVWQYSPLEDASAVKTRPLYVGVHDSTIKSGRVGLFTDRSAGAFRHLCVWSSPQMIRHRWEGVSELSLSQYWCQYGG